MENAGPGMILVSLRPRPIAAAPNDGEAAKRWTDLAAGAFARAKPEDEDIREGILRTRLTEHPGNASTAPEIWSRRFLVRGPHNTGAKPLTRRMAGRNFGRSTHY